MPASGRRKNFSKPLLLLAAAFAAVGTGGYLLIGRPMAPASEILRGPTKDGMILYEVPQNATTTFLAHDLRAKGLIAFPRVFKAFIRLTGQERKIRAGFYYLPPRNSVLEVAVKLTSGKMATQSITIPEGKASWEIFGILKRYFELDSAKYDSLIRSPEFARALGLEAPSLEGYLFPDTYVMPFRIAEKDLLAAMVRRFQSEAASLPPQSDVIRNYGAHGWVTLASIVEKEASVASERVLIAGVFYNRLRLGWNLGADPTVRFVLRKLTGPLYVVDLSVNSPYNTRRYAGLPPGPICNPGRKALLAALNPEKTKMMFFVAKDDGSREHFFSATNPEHDRFKVQAAENRKLRQTASALDSNALSPKELQPGKERKQRLKKPVRARRNVSQ